MPSATEIRSMIHSYVDMMCSSDIKGITALYAQDATAEDPVGGDIQQGVEAISAFYAMTAPMLQVELTGPICVAGNTVAFPLMAELTIGEDKSYLDATDVLEFNEEGKIVSMKAYWNPAEMRTQRSHE